MQRIFTLTSARDRGLPILQRNQLALCYFVGQHSGTPVLVSKEMTCTFFFSCWTSGEESAMAKREMSLYVTQLLKTFKAGRLFLGTLLKPVLSFLGRWVGE